MKNIEVKVLNPEVVKESEKMMVCAARLTQRGHKIKNMDDFLALYNKSYQEDTARTMTKLPHPTIQKFGVINVVVVGASSRFLRQITRHQNEVKFMSASLQYSDYSKVQSSDDFVIPYEILGNKELEDEYITACQNSMKVYADLAEKVEDTDNCGYLAPNGLRNVLIISATPYQWKHMISQRSCNRNTKETQFVMLKIWEELYKLSPVFFNPETTGPFCMKDKCLEGKMCCGKVFDKGMTPTEMLYKVFPKVYESTNTDITKEITENILKGNIND